MAINVNESSWDIRKFFNRKTRTQMSAAINRQSLERNTRTSIKTAHKIHKTMLLLCSVFTLINSKRSEEIFIKCTSLICYYVIDNNRNESIHEKNINK